MARKRFTTEQIIGLLREAEVRLGQGQTIGTICRAVGITEQSYYRWRRAYGCLRRAYGCLQRIASQSLTSPRLDGGIVADLKGPHS